MAGLHRHPWLALVGALTLATACNDDVVSSDDEVGDSGSETAADTETDSGTESGESTTDSADTGESTESTDSADTGESTESTDGTDTGGSETDSGSESGTDTGTESGTDTGTDTGGDTEGMEACDLPADTSSFALTGSQAPPDGCNNHTFTGRLEGGGNGTWFLDACPCGAQCLVPDPYELAVDLPDMSLLPAVPACPIIHFVRDPDTCEPAAIVIGDLDQDEAPVWIISHEGQAPLDAIGLEVAPVLGTICIDKTQYALEFTWDDQLVLSQGEQGELATNGPTWDVKNYASLDGQDDSVFDWVMKAQ